MEFIKTNDKEAIERNRVQAQEANAWFRAHIDEFAGCLRELVASPTPFVKQIVKDMDESIKTGEIPLFMSILMIATYEFARVHNMSFQEAFSRFFSNCNEVYGIERKPPSMSSDEAFWRWMRMDEAGRNLANMLGKLTGYGNNLPQKEGERT